MPAPAVKYGGSLLWAIMVYWLTAALLPRTSTLRLAAIALAFAIAVECFKLVYTPALDAFRLTLAGRLLLGRIPSLADILAYTVAIALTATADKSLRRHAHL